MKSDFFPLISLGNEAPIDVDTGGLLRPGVIALANESRLTTSSYSEALTNYSVNYRDPENLLAAVDYIAPPVPTGRRFEFKKGDADEAFLVDIDDERPIGGGFKKVAYAGSTQLGKTAHRGLTIVIDLDEEGGLMAEENATGMLMQRIIRNKYKRAITALNAMNAGEAASFTKDTNPDALVKAALAKASLDGAFANRGVFGLNAWNFRDAAYTAQNTAGATAALTKSIAQVATDYALDDLRIDKALFTVKKGEKARIVGSTFYAVSAHDGISKDDPSNLKQFYTPANGQRFRVYRKLVGEADNLVQITVSHYESIMATSLLGSVRLNITAA